VHTFEINSNETVLFNDFISFLFQLVAGFTNVNILYFFLGKLLQVAELRFFFPAVPDAQVGRLYRALILLGLALCLPSASMSNVFMVLYI